LLDNLISSSHSIVSSQPFTFSLIQRLRISGPSPNDLFDFRSAFGAFQTLNKRDGDFNNLVNNMLGNFR